MKVIIDRFEENIAVCEKPDKTMIEIERSSLPTNATEGSVLIIEKNKFSLDTNETILREQQAAKLFNELIVEDE